MRIEVDINGTITEHEDAPVIERANEEIEAERIAQKIQESQHYLNSTDWYYARLAETGEKVPEDIVSKRLECREFIRANS